jgi:hypothetical protein
MDSLKSINQNYIPELLIIWYIFTYVFKKIIFSNYTNKKKYSIAKIIFK